MGCTKDIAWSSMVEGSRGGGLSGKDTVVCRGWLGIG